MINPNLNEWGVWIYCLGLAGIAIILILSMLKELLGLIVKGEGLCSFLGHDYTVLTMIDRVRFYRCSRCNEIQGMAEVIRELRAHIRQQFPKEGK